MRLTSPDEIPKTRVRASFGHRPWGALVALALCSGGAAFLGFVAWRAWLAWPWWAWIPAAPVLLLGVLLEWVVLGALLNAVLACFRAGNWVAKVGDDGLWLKLRSYQNEHFGGDDPTVVFVPFDELRAAGKVVELSQRRIDDAPATLTRPMLDLHVAAPTGELAAAVERERTRRAPERRFLFLATRSRAHHVPVMVPAEGVVRVEWRGKRLLALLPSFVERLPQVRVRVGECGGRPADVRDAARELAQRGDRLAAVALVRERLGVGLGEAVRLVDALDEAA